MPSRLDAWIFEGEHAWLFDNKDDQLDFENRVLGFDMTELLEDRRLRTPVLLYLFHRIEQVLDGSPTMILIDEAWKALDDPMFAARIRNWMKTLRKRNAMIGFATQSAADALDSSISSAIVEQTATAIFMPNTKAREEHYCKGFGLSGQEFEFIRSLPAHSHCFLVRQANRSVVVRLDLGAMPDLLTVLSGRESSVRPGGRDELVDRDGEGDRSHGGPSLRGNPGARRIGRKSSGRQLRYVLRQPGGVTLERQQIDLGECLLDPRRVETGGEVPVIDRRRRGAVVGAAPRLGVVDRIRVADDPTLGDRPAPRRQDRTWFSGGAPRATRRRGSRSQARCSTRP